MLQREKKRFAGTEEVSSVAAKGEKEVCGNRGSVQRCCKGRKRGLRERRKNPALLQRVKKRFAGTKEVSSVAAKGEKEICRHRGSVQRCCKGRKRDLQERRKNPALLQRVKKRFAGTEEESSVATKGKKEICRHRGRIQRCYKGRKRGLRERRKCPALLQREKKRFAGTEEKSSVAAKGKKEVCRHRGRIQRCCKG
ncbi:hypothetical protein QA612_07685 [Evansella sp. AB-P1]|uniref:hypothetical protein n=1 Tax=Evansella sp. AB-P1 TaxID=3037653 RepID=UPI00241FCFAF|nr:hypothetical protein [Evansella sp. AB-P1]MDG5787372.1 hypothetical protein [Evansella sp. AB-P1]